MAVNRDWIPKQMDKFKIFGDNLCKRIVDNAAKWHLDGNEIAALLALQVIFNKYYAITCVRNTYSTLDTQNTKEARKLYQKALRLMGIKRLKRNTFMLDSERTGCGLNNNANTYTLSPIAKISPLIDFKNKDYLNGKIVCINPVSYKACKPDGQDGMKIAFGFYRPGKPIPRETQCPFTILLSKCHGKVVFPEIYAGFQFVAFARYYNTRGIMGLVATKFYGTVC